MKRRHFSAIFCTLEVERRSEDNEDNESNKKQ